MQVNPSLKQADGGNMIFHMYGRAAWGVAPNPRTGLVRLFNADQRCYACTDLYFWLSPSVMKQLAMTLETHVCVSASPRLDSPGQLTFIANHMDGIVAPDSVLLILRNPSGEVIFEMALAKGYLIAEMASASLSN